MTRIPRRAILDLMAMRDFDEGGGASVVRRAVERLVAAAPVERILLFGSRARGDSAEGSDVDLCVLLDDRVRRGEHDSISLWKMVADLPLAFHVVPMRLGAFERARDDVNSVAFDVARDGIVLYDRRAVEAAE